MVQVNVALMECQQDHTGLQVRMQGNSCHCPIPHALLLFLILYRHPLPPPQPRRRVLAWGESESDILAGAIFLSKFYLGRTQLTVPETESEAVVTGHNIAVAAELLRQGGVVAIPTDTLYGLAADAFNATAIERVFAVKERPDGMALPVLLADADQLPSVVNAVPPEATLLAAKFWPGSLTLILERNPSLPPRLTAGSSTVAVRVPGHPAPRDLARLLGRPVTGTSANISGWPDPQSIGELRAQVGDRVDAIVDAGPAPAGTASTIIDLSDGAPKLIREGAIPFADIAALLNSH